jgi:hypothetical protein
MGTPVESPVHIPVPVHVSTHQPVISEPIHPRPMSQSTPMTMAEASQVILNRAEQTPVVAPPSSQVPQYTSSEPLLSMAQNTDRAMVTATIGPEDPADNENNVCIACQ